MSQCEWLLKAAFISADKQQNKALIHCDSLAKPSPPDLDDDDADTQRFPSVATPCPHT